MKTCVVGFRMALDEKAVLERAMGMSAGEAAKRIIADYFNRRDYRGLGVDSLLDALEEKGLDARDYIERITEGVRCAPGAWK